MESKNSGGLRFLFWEQPCTSSFNGWPNLGNDDESGSDTPPRSKRVPLDLVRMGERFIELCARMDAFEMHVAARLARCEEALRDLTSARLQDRITIDILNDRITHLMIKEQHNV